MKRLTLLSLVAFSALSFAETVIPSKLTGYLEHSYTTENGAAVTELVKIPEGASAEEYAATAIPVFTKPLEAEKPKGLLSLVPTGNGATLVYTIRFAEFRDLLPVPQWTQPVVAQNGGPEIMPEKKPGILSRSLEVAKENPWPTGIAAFLLADYATGGGINAFGLLGGDDSGGKRPTVNVSGERNVVTITDNTNSGNDNSNRPSTAAPFFPPE